MCELRKCFCKRLWGVLCFVLCCVMGPFSAEAEQKGSGSTRFDNFAIALPKNWTTKEDGAVISLASPEGNCVFSVMVVDQLQVPFRELVISFYQNLHGKRGMADENGMTFELTTEDGTYAVTRLSQNKHLLGVVTAIGQCLPYDDALYSLQIVDDKGEPYVNPVRPYPLLGKDAEVMREVIAEEKKIKAQETKEAEKKAASQSHDVQKK